MPAIQPDILDDIAYPAYRYRKTPPQLRCLPGLKQDAALWKRATCVYNYIDLQVKNNTGHPYQLCVRLTDEYLEGEWRTLSEPEYKYEVYEKEHRITHETWGGYMRHNVIGRRVYERKTGGLIGDEYITENHAVMMYQPFLKEGSNSN